jgi:hypothetical protein
VFNGTFNNMSVIAFSFIGRWVENGGNGGNWQAPVSFNRKVDYPLYGYPQVPVWISCVLPGHFMRFSYDVM